MEIMESLDTVIFHNIWEITSVFKLLLSHCGDNHEQGSQSTECNAATAEDAHTSDLHRPYGAKDARCDQNATYHCECDTYPMVGFQKIYGRLSSFSLDQTESFGKKMAVHLTKPDTL